MNCKYCGIREWTTRKAETAHSTPDPDAEKIYVCLGTKEQDDCPYAPNHFIKCPNFKSDVEKKEGKMKDLTIKTIKLIKKGFGCNKEEIRKFLARRLLVSIDLYSDAWFASSLEGVFEDFIENCDYPGFMTKMFFENLNPKCVRDTDGRWVTVYQSIIDAIIASLLTVPVKEGDKYVNGFDERIEEEI